jgi:hypothetical protein
MGLTECIAFLEKRIELADQHNNPKLAQDYTDCLAYLLHLQTASKRMDVWSIDYTNRN